MRALCINEKNDENYNSYIGGISIFPKSLKVVNRCYMLLHITYNIQSYFPIFQILHIVPETGKTIMEKKYLKCVNISKIMPDF